MKQPVSQIKNKCEEILNDPEPVDPSSAVAVCVFDLNNLRSINNNLGAR